jgi:sulfoxide reductase heme-binding subunit YedZ
MVAGILQTMKWFSPRIGGIVYTVHQSSGWFGLLFGMIHGLVLLFDKQVGYTLIEISIPFTSHYKPFESGLGILAFYAMFLLVVSSYLMKHLGKKLWRSIYFPLFYLSTNIFRISFNLSIIYVKIKHN